mgnify:CR=1 FL=1
MRMTDYPKDAQLTPEVFDWTQFVTLLYSSLDTEQMHHFP